MLEYPVLISKSCSVSTGTISWNGKLSLCERPESLFEIIANLYDIAYVRLQDILYCV